VVLEVIQKQLNPEFKDDRDEDQEEELVAGCQDSLKPSWEEEDESREERGRNHG
jgi:hypothetical protein